MHEMNCSNSEIFMLQAYSSVTKVGKSATRILILHTLGLLVPVVDIIDIENSESHADVFVYRTPSTL